MLDKGTKTTTTQTKYPEWVEQAIAALTQSGMGGRPTIAGMTADQTQAGNLYRNAAERAAGGTDFASRIAGSGQVGAGDIQPLMGSYASAVGDDRIKALTESYNNRNAEAAARAASGVAFGGSGSALALERAQNDRNEATDKSAAMNEVLSQAYTNAQGLAEGNASRGQAGLIAGDNAETNALNRTSSAAANLYGYGAANQDIAQRGLDSPWDQIQKYINLMGGTSETSTPQTMDLLALLLGIGNLNVGSNSVAGRLMPGGSPSSAVTA